MIELYSPDLIINSNVITTRIRLARNLSGYPFRIRDKALSQEIIKKIKRAIAKCGDFSLYYLSDFDEISLESLKERHIISQALINNKEHGAILINESQSISLMIHEEDVIREQCFSKGLNLEGCYRKLLAVDEEIIKNLDVAFSDKYGYLTACPTNVGTGLRASVMIFLPAVTECEKLKDVTEILKSKGLTIRGVYGEGSKAEGYMYQISNEATLGLTEQEILLNVQKAVESLCELERDLMVKNFTKNDLKTIDKIKRAYGILSNAVLLSYQDFLHHVSILRLGALLGYVDVEEIGSLDDLQVDVRPANLMDKYRRILKQTEEEYYRAETVRDEIKKIVKA